MTARIRNREHDLAELREERESISINLDGMPHGTSLSDKTARLAAQLADAEEEIIELRSEAWSIRMEIVRTLNGIQTPEYNTLLYLRYIEGKTWEQIAVEMHYSIQHIYRMHDSALAAVTEILDARSA
jgi:DNA-directed RNA polymerase specialized sigma24 family protein